MKIPLTSGAYRSRALDSNAQRCVNLYVEANPEETNPLMPTTHYPRPGLISLRKPPVQGRGRGLYRTSNGDLYGVVGPNVYFIDKNWNFNNIGSIGPQNNPVSFADNGISNGNAIVLVDNTPLGYQINMSSRQMTQIVDPTGLFTGATKVEYFDTFFCFNQIGTNNWYVSLSNQVAFNALEIASKGTYADPIQSLIASQRILWLVGQMTAEPWFDAGDPIFPFEETFGQFIPHGTVAPYSVCTTDVNAFWLSQDKDGHAIFLMTVGYAANRVSTHALENEWDTYPTVADAISYTYQQSGHTFVVINFPSADKTWSYDLATKQWHQRAWIDQNGTLHRERVAFHAFAYDTNVGMDWQTGEIYELDLNTFTDAGNPITFIRSFPHIGEELKEITHVAFVADMQTGTQSGTSESGQSTNPWSDGFSPGFGPAGSTDGPKISLRYSNDGGATWSNYRQKGLVSAGNYRSMMRWRGLGMARDRVYELQWSAPFLTGLNGAYLEAIGHSA
jgi:hypothetical protein